MVSKQYLPNHNHTKMKNTDINHYCDNTVVAYQNQNARNRKISWKFRKKSARQKTEFYRNATSCLIGANTREVALPPGSIITNTSRPSRPLEGSNVPVI
jgi:hypothetical protein